MKLLITGGSGFIGSRLIRRALDKGYEVVLLKRNTSNLGRIEDLTTRIQIYDWDKVESLKEVFHKEKIDVVVHLAAAYVKYDKTEKERMEMYQTNVVRATELLNVCVGSGVKVFVNTGSFFEFEPIKTPLKENSTIKPVNYYAETKILFERELKKVAKAKKIKGVTIRPFSPYGPGDRRTVICLLTKALLTKTPLILKNSAERLSFTFIDDLINAYTKVIDYMLKNQVDYEDFNVGASESYLIKEVGVILEKIVGERGYIKYNVGEERKSMCDNTKAKKILNWQTQTKIEDGLKKTYEYLKREVSHD